ncbi:hypothetical protein EOD41_00495 [Mucilaginibacter limnophilus]|uniref:NHL repeat containing protein n=1 Tax=Mucilaginibacter limnophilus TaxID=1932778 RepID=A0A3S2VA18_9SPHI|nr:hypothetical protein [Mucilaginibacter limnophilus]RVU02452.1 hypothetical protein EOD41_00495 [Mucilaginibacter limnophilus]
MRRVIRHAVFTLGALSLLSSCKMDEPEYRENKAAAAVQVPAYSVFHIAGGAQPAGQDGEGTAANFNQPNGLELKPDGILYVADTYNNLLRKVVVKPLNGNPQQYVGTVTTLNTPAGANGLALYHPARVGVSDNGTINTIFRSPNSPFLIFGRIYTPDGDIFTQQTDRMAATGLTKEVYGDYYWFTGYLSVGKFWARHIQMPNIKLPLDTFITYDANGQSHGAQYPRSIFSCKNGVKYMASTMQLYKLTNSMQVSKIKPIVIYPARPFNDITDIVATADGKTIFLADEGVIKKVQDGIVTTILPIDDVTGKNGYAWGLALDEKNKMLYFSDRDYNRINILTLPGYVAH